jgi:hypothetical protein
MRMRIRNLSGYRDKSRGDLQEPQKLNARGEMQEPHWGELGGNLRTRHTSVRSRIAHKICDLTKGTTGVNDKGTKRCASSQFTQPPLSPFEILHTYGGAIIAPFLLPICLPKRVHHSSQKECFQGFGNFLHTCVRDLSRDTKIR